MSTAKSGDGNLIFYYMDSREIGEFKSRVCRLRLLKISSNTHCIRTCWKFGFNSKVAVTNVTTEVSYETKPTTSIYSFIQRCKVN